MVTKQGRSVYVEIDRTYGPLMSGMEKKDSQLIGNLEHEAYFGLVWIRIRLAIQFTSYINFYKLCDN